MATPPLEDGDPTGGDMPCYEPILRGRLDSSWSDWFCGLQVRTGAEGTTVLAAPCQTRLRCTGC